LKIDKGLSYIYIAYSLDPSIACPYVHNFALVSIVDKRRNITP
jgi:hypothetical protein